MEDYGLRPEPPTWALEVGIPEPLDGEGFLEYVKRLGLDPRPLVEGLTEQTMPVANVRLGSTLQHCMQQRFDRYIADRIEPARRKELENYARSMWGDRFRSISLGG